MPAHWVVDFVRPKVTGNLAPRAIIHSALYHNRPPIFIRSNDGEGSRSVGSVYPNVRSIKETKAYLPNGQADEAASTRSREIEVAEANNLIHSKSTIKIMYSSSMGMWIYESPSR